MYFSRKVSPSNIETIPLVALTFSICFSTQLLTSSAYAVEEALNSHNFILNREDKILIEKGRVSTSRKTYYTAVKAYREKNFKLAERKLTEVLEIISKGYKNNKINIPGRYKKSKIPLIGFWISQQRKQNSNSRFGSITSPSFEYMGVNILKRLRDNDHISIIFSDLLDIASKEQKIITEFLTSNISEEHLQRMVNPTKDDQLLKLDDLYKIEHDTLTFLMLIQIVKRDDEAYKYALEISQRLRELELEKITPIIEFQYSNPNSIKSLDNYKSYVPIEDILHSANKNNLTYIYYHVLNKKYIFVWVVKPNNSIIFKQIKIAEKINLEEVINNTLEATSSFLKRGQETVALIKKLRDDTDRKQKFISAENQSKLLQNAYEIIIKPIEENLPNKLDSEVFIIPHDVLYNVPFTALKNESNKYLIENYVIRESISFYSSIHKKRNNNNLVKRNNLFVGDPTNKKVIGAEKNSEIPEKYQGIFKEDIKTKVHDNLPRLPGARKEISSIASLYRQSSLTGVEATKKNVLDRIKDSNIIHFATHGLLNLERPSEFLLAQQRIHGKKWLPVTIYNSRPRIGKEFIFQHWYGKNLDKEWQVTRIYTPFPGSIALSDSFLSAKEISQLDLKADLVILSACSTGNGTLSDSMLLGLPLSFGIAGVPKALISKWSVPDDSTAKLMYEFHLSMLDQDKKGEIVNEAKALRQAILKVKNIREYQDPINWAGFTVIDVALEK